MHCGLMRALKTPRQDVRNVAWPVEVFFLGGFLTTVGKCG